MITSIRTTKDTILVVDRRKPTDSTKEDIEKFKAEYPLGRSLFLYDKTLREHTGETIRRDIGEVSLYVSIPKEIDPKGETLKEIMDEVYYFLQHDSKSVGQRVAEMLGIDAEYGYSPSGDDIERFEMLKTQLLKEGR